MTELPTISQVEEAMFAIAGVPGPREFVESASTMFGTAERQAANKQLSDVLGFMIDDIGMFLADEFGAVYVAFADRLGLNPEGPLCDQRGHDPDVFEREWAALMVAMTPVIMAMAATHPDQVLTTEDRLRQRFALQEAGKKRKSMPGRALPDPRSYPDAFVGAVLAVDKNSNERYQDHALVQVLERDFVDDVLNDVLEAGFPGIGPAIVAHMGLPGGTRIHDALVEPRAMEAMEKFHAVVTSMLPWIMEYITDHPQVVSGPFVVRNAADIWAAPHR